MTNAPMTNDPELMTPQRRLTGRILLKLPYYLLTESECPPGYIQKIRPECDRYDI
jgi:hypothetical protein